MKKIIVALMLSLVISNAIAYEGIKFKKDADLSNKKVDSYFFFKKKTIDDMTTESKENKPQINLDVQQIEKEMILDYTTNPINIMVP